MTAESIIFDLDGTLWDSSESVAESWTEALRLMDEPAVSGMTVTIQDMHRIMGKTMDEIADTLFPMLPQKQRMDILGKCMEHENAYISRHGGRLFECETETLEKLSQSHRLFIVSNCQKGYIEAFLQFSGYGRFFADHMCWGDTEMPKSYTIKALMERCGCKSAVYVGDTQGDCDASFDAGIPFIHAAYGFGEISTPEKVAAAIPSLSALAECALI